MGSKKPSSLSHASKDVGISTLDTGITKPRHCDALKTVDSLSLRHLTAPGRTSLGTTHRKPGKRKRSLDNDVSRKHPPSFSSAATASCGAGAGAGRPQMDHSQVPVRAAPASENPPKRKIHDWLRAPHPENLTPFQRFVVDLDWTKSPLGPISTWPPQLHQMVLLVMSDPSPAVVYWGEEATIVYNEPYTQLIGQKHPSLQGQDPRVGFAEIWDHFENLLSRQRETGETTVEANALLLLFRHGFLEETYFSWKFVPIIGPEGWVVGSHATVVEVTREVVSDRRLSTVRALSRELSGASTIHALWSAIIRG
jgi:hypothetical protein